MPLSIVILGAGGHGKEVADLAFDTFQSRAPDLNVRFLDDFIAQESDSRILGKLDWPLTHELSDLSFINGMGNPVTARKAIEPLEHRGCTFQSIVAKSAWVSPKAQLGIGVVLFPFSFLSTDAVVGDHSILNVGTSVSHDARIGKFCNLNPGARIAGNVQIDDGCYIGMGARIKQGLHIGSAVTIGAGAVVLADVPDNATVVGIPAREIKRTAPSA